MTQTILSSNGIHRLHHRFFVPQGEIKATLLIVHGMSEHGGRYANFAQFLADNGVLVATYDQLGHGQTVKDKYELGFFDEKHPVQTLCKDVIVMADTLKEQAKSLTDRRIRHYLMGHSMGSFIVRTVLVHHASSFDGAILMGTGNSFGVLGQLGKNTLWLLNRLAAKQPNPKIGRLLNQYLLGKIQSPISASPFAWLSENPDSIKQFEQDPLCGFTFSNNGFYTLLCLMQRACRSDWHENLSPDFRLLLIGGKDDPVSNMGQEITQLQDELLSHQKSCTVRLYPNARHEILHEDCQTLVYDDVFRWLKISKT